jgi:YD repeat-containing protein
MCARISFVIDALNVRMPVARESARLVFGHASGRVARDRVDLNANGVFTNGPPDATAFGEMDDTRVYNKRNELRERSVLDSTNPTTPRIVALDYDRNGNLTSDGEKHTYTFNPFGQLVRINDYRHGDLIARFTYNGLGQRISEQTDVNNAANTGEPDGKVTSDDPVFYLAVDPQGRRVATYRDQDRHPKETFVWTLTGISGPGGVANGTLILRDRNENGADPLAWATVEGSDTRPERHYSVSDHTGSVVALLGLHNVNDAPTAKLAEQYRYSVTGVPYGIPLGDVDASGGVEDIGGGTSLDKAIVSDLESTSTYQVRGDLNLDGLVDSQDIAIVDAALGTSTGRGYFGIITLRNRVGLGQLERTLRVGPGWSTGGGVYREDINRHVGTEAVGGGGAGVNPRDIAPPGCVKVACPTGDCRSWSCGLEVSYQSPRPYGDEAEWPKPRPPNPFIPNLPHVKSPPLHVWGNWCGPGVGGPVWDGRPGGGWQKQRCGPTDNGWTEGEQCDPVDASDSCCMAHDRCMYETGVSYFWDGVVPYRKSECHKICDATMCTCLKAAAKQGLEPGASVINFLMQMTFCNWNDGAPNDTGDLHIDGRKCDNGQPEGWVEAPK